jgi:hypothetical protein
MDCFAKKLTELVFPANTFSQYHRQQKRLFDNIYGYDTIKRLFRMTLESTHPQLPFYFQVLLHSCHVDLFPFSETIYIETKDTPVNVWQAQDLMCLIKQFIKRIHF